MRITIKSKPNYWRFTVYNWLLEIKDILESELGEKVEITVVEGDNDEPEFYLNGFFIGMGVPGEEGYLLEIIKKAYYRVKESNVNVESELN